MLIFDKQVIGNKLFSFRKKSGLTQAELAETSGISDRTYADIERGTVNMKLETLLQICNALQITPDEILTDSETLRHGDELFEMLQNCTSHERETAFKLLQVYLDSIR